MASGDWPGATWRIQQQHTQLHCSSQQRPPTSGSLVSEQLTTDQRMKGYHDVRCGSCQTRFLGEYPRLACRNADGQEMTWK